MTDLERALAEIGAIRSQLAQGSRFHGLGPTAFTATGVLAMAAALLQWRLIGLPQEQVGAFLSLWITVAAVSAGVIGFEMIFRSRRMHSQLADEMIVASVGQFLPAGATGVLLTGVLMWFTPQNLWMLPGLWQIVFGIGVFASCRFLPRWMAVVGGWYVLCGLACLAFAQGPLALSPWSMGVPFGLGQILVAAVLRFAGETDE
ncbi:MAG TPA: hypothetical protein VHW60_14060 [Caulobacteraceae bacterium]|jgi:hypothetical protein|nr:hypothetical protein [Caulobacteraceae bacterium]